MGQGYYSALDNWNYYAWKKKVQLEIELDGQILQSMVGKVMEGEKEFENIASRKVVVSVSLL